MAREIPWYDTSRKSSGRNQLRLHKQNVTYFSDYKAFRYQLTRNDVIKRMLFLQALRARAAWKRQIPFGSDGSDGHIRDHVKIRSRVPGGVFKDRATYEVYNDYPNYAAIEGGRRKADGKKDTWFWAAVKSMENGGLT